MDPTIKIYLINGAFLIFDKESALRLRRSRLLGQPIGCSPINPHQVSTSDLPCLINHHVVTVILERKLAEFKTLILRPQEGLNESKYNYSRVLANLKNEAEKEFTQRRVDQLKQRNLEVSSKNIGKFSESNMRLPISNTPDTASSFDEKVIDYTEVVSLLDVNQKEMAVFRDLYNRTFYVSLGMKFASNFLVYPDDPVGYHAQYAVRVMPNLDDLIDLSQTDYHEINALHRLCHTANKMPLFAVAYEGPEGRDRVKYWTLKPRVYLSPDSDHTIFVEANPLPSKNPQACVMLSTCSSLDQSTSLEASTNKIRKT